MSTEVLARWLKWNVRGIGKDRSSPESSKYHYVGKILYAHGYPVSRLMQRRPDDNWVCITKNGDRPTNPKEWKDEPRLMSTIFTTCVGAFSKFEADVLPDDQMHERIKWLSHLEAQSLIDQALLTSAAALVVKPKYSTSLGKRLIDRETSVHKVYDAYREAFGLDWPKWPLHYGVDLVHAVEMKRQAYHDPKSVEKRERATSKKAARKAFDLD